MEGRRRLQEQLRIVSGWSYVARGLLLTAKDTKDSGGLHVDGK